MLVASDPEGNQQPIRVHEVAEDKIVLDFNHPLAGQPLSFDIEILAATAAGPTAIAVTFASPAVVDAVCALETDGGRLRPIELPPVGRSITVTYQPLMD